MPETHKQVVLCTIKWIPKLCVLTQCFNQRWFISAICAAYPVFVEQLSLLFFLVEFGKEAAALNLPPTLKC